MNPFPSIYKRTAILVVIILSACGITLSIYAQPDNPIPPQATQLTSGIMPTYVPCTQILHEFPNYQDTAANANHNKLYVTNWYGYLTVIDTQLGIVETTLTNIHRPESLFLSPDGSHLYISSNVLGYEDGLITILDTESLTIVDTHVYPNIKDYPYYSGVRSMSLGPTNKLFIVPNGDYLGNSIDTMDTVSGDIVATLPFSGHIVSLASQNNTMFATYLDLYGASKLFKYDISTGTPVTETAVTINATGYLTLTPDNSTVLIRSSEGDIHQYNAATLQFIRTYSVDNTYGFVSLAVSQDSQNLIGLYRPNGFSGPGALRVFDLATGQIQRTYQDTAGVNPVYDTASFADDKVALIGGTGVRLLKPADYQIALPLILNKYCSSPVLDDFSNPASGWPNQDTGSAIYRYLDNEYNIYHRDANRWGAVTRGDVWNQSKLIQASGRIAQNQGMWGLLFGLNSDWTGFYTFEISPNDQKWYLLHYMSGTGWHLIEQGSSPAIRPGSASNTLSIHNPYGTTGLQINGTWITFPYVLSNRVGRVGLTGASFQSNVDIRYDDYVFVDQNCPMPATNEVKTFTSEIMNLKRPNIEDIPQFP